MFGNRRRVEQDLERIRTANLSDEARAREEEQTREERRRLADSPKIGAKDMLAMALAAFSVLIPYVLAFIGLWIAFGIVGSWLAR